MERGDFKDTWTDISVWGERRAGKNQTDAVEGEAEDDDRACRGKGTHPEQRDDAPPLTLNSL